MRFLILLSILGASLAKNVASPRWISSAETHDMNGQDKGDWGLAEICSTLAFPTAVSIKHDGYAHLPLDDKTGETDGRTADRVAATGLKFYCTADTVVDSLSDSQGEWLTKVECPGSGRMKGMALNTKHTSSRTFDDNLGVEDVKILCEDFTELDAIYGQVTRKINPEAIEKLQAEAASLTSGDLSIAVPVHVDVDPTIYDDYWGPMYYCSANTYICGLQTRVDKTDSFDDNAGLTDVIFYCCY